MNCDVAYLTDVYGLHDSPMENWKDVPSMPGFQVSDIGRVRTLAIPRPAGRRLSGKILVQDGDKVRGFCIRYRDAPGSRKKSGLVHRLVALTFLPPPGEGQNEVDHKNGDRSDNSVGNLRWATRYENQCNSSSTWASSGIRGVSYCKRARKWRAHIKANGKFKYLGLFADKNDAAAARAAAEKIYQPSKIR